MAVQLIPIPGIPEVHQGDDVAALIADALRDGHFTLLSDDIVVVAQKVISKAEGAVRCLRDVHPAADAVSRAERRGGDPRLIQVILDETVRVLRDDRVLVVETRHGFVCANAGVDHSNVPGDEMVTLLPSDSDASAHALRSRLRELTGAAVGVIVSDTFGRPWRMGIANVALGLAGLPALVDYRGSADDNGEILSATLVAVADELAGAAELVMGKTNRLPVVIIRGYQPAGTPGSGRDLIRPPDEDLFR